jgi:glycosyltransferase involved in cell wall biosynthesis
MTGMHVLVTAYRLPAWRDRCLESIAAQTRAADGVLVVDDASPDPGYEAETSGFCAAHGWAYHRNETNLRCPRNFAIGIPMLTAGPDDVVVLIDGDDWFPDDALAQVAAVYDDPDVWLTYGSMEPWPDPAAAPRLPAPYPEEVIAANRYRQHRWPLFNHPITFRRRLWDYMADDEFLDSEGRWFRAAGDIATVIPLLELAGRHHRFLPDVLYHYTTSNPAGYAGTQSAECGRVEVIVRHRPAHKPLDQ